MNFYGADTAQLREQAARTEHGVRELERWSSLLHAAAQSVLWAGEDAETFRSGAADVTRHANATAAELSAFGRLLREQATQQDRCSSATDVGGDLLAMVREGLVGGLFGGVFGRLTGGREASDGIGFGGGLMNSMTTPIDPGVFAPDTSYEVGTSRSLEAGEVKGTSSTTVEEDGTTTHELSLEEEHTVWKVGDEAGGASSEVTVHRGESASVTVNPDGTTTVVFEASVGASGESSADVRGVEVGADASVEAAGSYSVTLPPGMDPSVAAGINPFDPDTLPPGASVTTTATLSGELGASLGISGAGEVSAGVTGSEELVTTVTHTTDGTFTVDSGPGTARGINYGVQIGPDQANVTVEGGWTTKETVVEHTEFDSGEAGRAGVRDMVRTGESPSETSEGVLDQYTDTIRSTADSTSVTGSVDVGGASGSVHAGIGSATVHDVTRDYPDGSWVREERSSSFSEGVQEGHSYATKHTSSWTDEPSYELNYVRNANTPDTSFHDRYDLPVKFGQDETVSVSLTQAEMDQILENNPGRFGDEMTVLNHIAAQGPNAADELATLYSGHPHGELPGSATPNGETPGGAADGGTSTGKAAVPSAS